MHWTTYIYRPRLTCYTFLVASYAAWWLWTLPTRHSEYWTVLARSKGSRYKYIGCNIVPIAFARGDSFPYCGQPRRVRLGARAGAGLRLRFVPVFVSLVLVFGGRPVKECCAEEWHVAVFFDHVYLATQRFKAYIGHGGTALRLWRVSVYFYTSLSIKRKFLYEVPRARNRSFYDVMAFSMAHTSVELSVIGYLMQLTNNFKTLFLKYR